MDYSLYNGRQQILTSATPTAENIISILESAMAVHETNKTQIDFLFNYYLGNQPIYTRSKFIRPEINARLAENNAYLVVRIITGYTFGKPVQYVQRFGEKADPITELNTIMEDEAKSTVDMEVAKHQSICGTGFKLIVADPDNLDDHPIMLRAMHPSTTFVVYSSGAAKLPVMGVSYYDVPSAPPLSAPYDIRHFDVYTRDRYYHIYGQAGQYQSLTIETTPHTLRDVCIVEFPNDSFRLGDFEPALPIFDAVNELDSDRANAIAQFVQAYLKFINCEMTEEEFNKAKRMGAFMVNSPEGLNADIGFIESQLSQSDAETLSSRYDDKWADILGIPQRAMRAGGGGDTGQAVSLRDGWADLETVAMNKENSYKPPERRVLRIALNILHTRGYLKDLEVGDIEIKFIRNRSDNLLVKSQSYTTLRQGGMNDLDALQAVSLFTDPAEVAERNRVDMEAKEAKALALMKTTSELKKSDSEDEPQSIDEPASSKTA